MISIQIFPIPRVLGGSFDLCPETGNPDLESVTFLTRDSQIGSNTLGNLLSDGLLTRM